MHILIKYIKKYKELDVAVKASFWYLMCKFLQSGISFITVPLFTRILSTEEYGMVSVFSSWTEILAIFVTLNLSYGIFSKGLLEHKEDRDAFVSQMQGLAFSVGVVSCIIFSILYFVGLETWVNVPLYIFELMLLHCLLSSGLNFWSVRQRFEFRYKPYAVVTILMLILSPAFSLLVVYHSKNKGLSRIWSSLVIPIVIYIVFCAINFIKGKSFYNRAVWKSAFKFNIVLLPHYLSQIVLSVSDRVMIGKYLGSADAGLYSIAYSSASILAIFNSAITAALNPWIFQNLDTKNYGAIKKQTGKVLIVVGILALLIILFAPEILQIFAPEEYANTKYAIPPIVIGLFYSFISSYFGNIEFYFLKNKMVLVASCCSAVINIVLNYIFIPVAGYIACAYTTLFCYFVFCVIHYFYIVKIEASELQNIHLFDIKKILLIATFVTIIGFLAILFYDITIFRLFFVLLLLCFLLFYIGKEKKNDYYKS